MSHHNGRFLREDDLRRLGIGAAGDNVRVHETCVLAGLENMRFGSNVRVDAFTVLSAGGGWIRTGDFVHIAAQAFVSAGSGVELGDFAGLAPGVRVFSRSDDYGGSHLTNPTVPGEHLPPPPDRPVVIGRHAIVGAGAVLLPEVELGEGAAVGALSLVTRSLQPWTVYSGSPARALRARSRDLLAREEALRAAMERGEATLPLRSL